MGNYLRRDGVIPQRTLASERGLTGIGLHTGDLTTITFRPTPAGTGIVFVREDLEGAPQIPARIENVAATTRGTTLTAGGVLVHTVEHVLAAVQALSLDNLAIGLTAKEPPVGDGSALPFMEVLAKGGICELEAEREVYALQEPFHYSEDGVEFLLLPSKEMKLSFHLEFEHPLVGSQYASLVVTAESFLKELAPARTFCFLEEVEPLRQSGLIKGGTLRCAVVIGPDRFLSDEPLRFPNEFVRHKMVDLLGDLSLLGTPIRAHLIASRAGHASNVNLVRRLAELVADAQGRRAVRRPVQMDINEILKILPHRYPFILVDRILEMEEGRRAVGIKNVTINEPFFQGHFPGHPVMPGVLQIEAMGQVGGLLLMNSVPDPENKVVYFMALDKIKFRKPVAPGDQLRLELEMVKLRGRTCKMRGKAYVAGECIAEAEMMAMVMDK